MNKLPEKYIYIVEYIIENCPKDNYTPFYILSLYEKINPRKENEWLDSEHDKCFYSIANWLKDDGKFIEYDRFLNNGSFVLTEKGLILRNLGYNEYIKQEKQKLDDEIKRQKLNDKLLEINVSTGKIQRNLLHINRWIAWVHFKLSLL